jgi:hypothetical protein
MSDIEEFKVEVEYWQKQYEVAKDNLEQCKKSLKEAQIEFRVEEVKRVLEGMRTLISLEAVDDRELYNYITHCLNCLYGNIDGIVISIDKDIEKAREERDKKVEE